MPVAQIALPRTTANRAAEFVSPSTAHQRRMLELFRVSLLKQQKWREVHALVGMTKGMAGLDVGADNGVLSYLLRQQGGRWISADLDQAAVDAIGAMVGGVIVRLDPDGGPTPFANGRFDVVVLLDCVEHVADDRGFLGDMRRIVKPGGCLVVNVPLRRDGWLRRLRLALGQTDAAHGHLRQGYTLDELTALLRPARVEESRTYSRDFMELIDVLITWVLQRIKGSGGVKGHVVTGADIRRHRRLLAVYRGLFPLFWLAAQADRLLWRRPGAMLLVRARVD